MGSDIPGTVFCATIVLLAAIAGYVFVRNREFRSRERLAALEKGVNSELFFSGRLLRYVPWRFWMSCGILISFVLLFSILKYKHLDDAAASFLELIKYVTGAVIGSMFGITDEKNSEAEKKS